MENNIPYGYNIDGVFTNGLPGMLLDDNDEDEIEE